MNLHPLFQGTLESGCPLALHTGSLCHLSALKETQREILPSDGKQRPVHKILMLLWWKAWPESA